MVELGLRGDNPNKIIGDSMSVLKDICADFIDFIKTDIPDSIMNEGEEAELDWIFHRLIASHESISDEAAKFLNSEASKSLSELETAYFKECIENLQVNILSIIRGIVS